MNYFKKRKAQKAKGKTTTIKQLKPVNPEVKNSMTKKRKFVKAEPDAQTQIVELNQVKLKRDITAMQKEFDAKGIKGNSGTAGFMVNRFELDNFIKKAKADGLTNAQALARFKKQYNL